MDNTQIRTFITPDTPMIYAYTLPGVQFRRVRYILGAISTSMSGCAMRKSPDYSMLTGSRSSMMRSLAAAGCALA